MGAGTTLLQLGKQSAQGTKRQEEALEVTLAGGMPAPAAANMQVACWSPACYFLCVRHVAHSGDCLAKPSMACIAPCTWAPQPPQSSIHDFTALMQGLATGKKRERRLVEDVARLQAELL